jgi:hypothetical protein
MFFIYSPVKWIILFPYRYWQGIYKTITVLLIIWAWHYISYFTAKYTAINTDVNAYDSYVSANILDTFFAMVFTLFGMAVVGWSLYGLYHGIIELYKWFAEFIKSNWEEARKMTENTMEKRRSK